MSDLDDRESRLPDAYRRQPRRAPAEEVASANLKAVLDRLDQNTVALNKFIQALENRSARNQGIDQMFSAGRPPIGRWEIPITERVEPESAFHQRQLEAERVRLRKMSDEQKQARLGSRRGGIGLTGPEGQIKLESGEILEGNEARKIIDNIINDKDFQQGNVEKFKGVMAEVADQLHNKLAAEVVESEPTGFFNRVGHVLTEQGIAAIRGAPHILGNIASLFGMSAPELAKRRVQGGGQPLPMRSGGQATGESVRQRRDLSPEGVPYEGEEQEPGYVVLGSPNAPKAERRAAAGGLRGIMATGAVRAIPILGAAMAASTVIQNLDRIPILGPLLGGDMQFGDEWRRQARSIGEDQGWRGMMPGGIGWENAVQSRRLGIDPRDLLTTRDARAVVETARARGLRGQQFQDITAEAADVVEETGLDPRELTDQFIDLVRGTGVSIEDLGDTFRDFDYIARDLNLSVETVSRGVTQFTGMFRAMGAGALSASQGTALMRALPTTAAENPDIIAQWATGNRDVFAGFAAARTGQSVLGFQLGQRPEMMGAGMDEMIDRFMGEGLPESSITGAAGSLERANFLTNMMPDFFGQFASEPEILRDMYTRLRSGRGIGTVMGMEAAANRYAKQVAQLPREQRRTQVPIARLLEEGGFRDPARAARGAIGLGRSVGKMAQGLAGFVTGDEGPDLDDIRRAAGMTDERRDAMIGAITNALVERGYSQRAARRQAEQTVKGGNLKLMGASAFEDNAKLTVRSGRVRVQDALALNRNTFDQLAPALRDEQKQEFFNLEARLRRIGDQNNGTIAARAIREEGRVGGKITNLRDLIQKWEREEGRPLRPGERPGIDLAVTIHPVHMRKWLNATGKVRPASRPDQNSAFFNKGDSTLGQ